MREGPMRKAVIGAAVVAAGILALTLQYLVRPSPLPEPGEYFLTELAWAQIGPVSIALGLIWAFAFGFASRLHPVLVGALLLAVFPLIAVYEGTRFRGSHNLLPFEVAITLALSVPLMVAAWLGRRLGNRRRPEP
jgi:hypothetical protein